jgi:hypothetical protein
LTSATLAKTFFPFNSISISCCGASIVMANQLD